MKINKIDYEIANELLWCDFETGKLYWKPRDRKWFTSDSDMKRWNTRYANKEAFTDDSNNTYKQGTMLGVKYLAHRIVFLLYYKRNPVGALDHKDKNGFNNNIFNLREDKDIGNNGKNRSKQKNNKTGYTGVNKVKNRYRARIRGDGKEVHLGYRDTPEEAYELYVQAKKEYGYTEGHGL